MGLVRETSSFLPEETEGDQFLLATGKFQISSSDEEPGTEAGVPEKRENCLHIDILHNFISTHCIWCRFETWFCVFLLPCNFSRCLG